MGGVDLCDGTLVVDRPPNELDDLAVSFSSLLQCLDVDHVFVVDYLAILTGRARATEDIDVFVEPLSEAEVTEVVDKLEAAEFWGPAMPLEEAYGNLSAGTNIWIAPEGQMTRNERKPTRPRLGFRATARPTSPLPMAVCIPQRLIYRESCGEVRKTAKSWRLGWGAPAGRKATTPSPRGRPRGPRGQSKRNPAPTWDGPPHRVAARRVDGPARGPVSNWGRRSLGVDTAREGEHVRPRMGPNQSPANRSTREGKFATGSGITGMPTACGIPRLKSWEEVKPHLEVKFPSDEFDEASLSNAIPATVGGETIPVGPLELQIAYKLSLGSRTDLEDAAHIYSVFGDSLSSRRLEQWVQRLGVSEEYARLRS